MRSKILSLIGIVLLPAFAAAQANPPAFTPVPCPEFTWENTDPAFQPLPGAKAFFGRYEGGLYQIEIPENWNGELVLYAHGAVRTIGGGGLRLAVQVPTLRSHWIKQGFAWAASSFRCNGSIFGIGLVDTMALSDVFQRVNPARAPTRTYLVGQSLGGRVTVLGLREFPSRFAGGLAMCPVGQETNDLRVAIVAAAEVVTGVRVAEATLDQDLARVTEIVGTFPNLTEKGQQLASIEIQISGGPRPFAMEGLASRLLANISDGVLADPPWILRASTNRDTQYAIDPGLGLTAEEINRRARRKEPEGNLRPRSGPYTELVPFDGRLERPLMTIEGTGDLQATIFQQRAFKSAVAAAGRDNMLVQRLMRIAGHCQFSEQEQLQSFDDLVRWVRTGVRPNGDDVMEDLTDAGRRFTNPLRSGDPGTVNLPASIR